MLIETISLGSFLRLLYCMRANTYGQDFPCSGIQEVRPQPRGVGMNCRWPTGRRSAKNPITDVQNRKCRPTELARVRFGRVRFDFCREGGFNLTEATALGRRLFLHWCGSPAP